jgi:hypothetical protein
MSIADNLNIYNQNDEYKHNNESELEISPSIDIAIDLDEKNIDNLSDMQSPIEVQPDPLGFEPRNYSYSVICNLCMTAIFFVLLCIPVLIVRGAVYLLLAPLGIPFYYYQTYLYNKWLAEWKATLCVNDINLIEAYLGGPINMNTIDAIRLKVHPTIYISFDSSQLNRYQTRYKYVPTDLLRNRFWVCSGLTHQDFIDGLSYMLGCLRSVNMNADKVMVSSKFIYSLLIDSQSSCSICMQEYTTDDISEMYLTKCNHIYHKNCLELWINRQHTCPICRTEIIV